MLGKNIEDGNNGVKRIHAPRFDDLNVIFLLTTS